METQSYSRAVMARFIQNQIQDTVESKKQKIVVLIDEAFLLRMEVFQELHTLTQFAADSTSWTNPSTAPPCPSLPAS
ncbi:MAG: hypothetical protein NTY64_24500 [Deltaproteobacteria bacterium]|nr:hypothetical protein [Deltaproteobacteria bacterium]